MKDYIKVLLGVGFAVIFFTAIGWVLMPVNKMVERQVLVNSHQYIEGMEQRAGVLRANIAEIDSIIISGQGDRDTLLAQKRALRAQLNAITR